MKPLRFIAGHETTAVLLTWAFCLLAQHPEVEAQRHAELAGRTPGAADVPNLRYTRMILDETLQPDGVSVWLRETKSPQRV